MHLISIIIISAPLHTITSQPPVFTRKQRTGFLDSMCVVISLRGNIFAVNTDYIDKKRYRYVSNEKENAAIDEIPYKLINPLVGFFQQ